MGSITIKAKNLYKIVKGSYITKVGGTYTKTAEEINYFTTEGGISLYSNKEINWKAEGMITLGESKEPEGFMKKFFAPVTVFFCRSDAQKDRKKPKVEEIVISDPKNNSSTGSSSVYSTTTKQNTADIISVDTDFDGHFGFDLYSPQVYTSDKVKNSYKLNTDIRTQIGSKNINYKTLTYEKNHVSSYYIPWICLLEGQSIHIKTKIFSEKRELESAIALIHYKLVTIDNRYVPIQEGATYVPYEGESISILADSHPLKNRDSQDGELQIQAPGVIENPIGLIAYYINGDESEIIVGQAIILPNKPYSIKLKFIQLKITNETDKVLYNDPHDVNTAAIQDYLNTKAMNQAAIQVTTNPKIDKLRIKENYTKEGQTVPFSELLEHVSLNDKPTLKIAFDNREQILAVKDDESEDLVTESIIARYKKFITDKILDLNAYNDLKETYKKHIDQENFLEYLLELYQKWIIPVFLCEDFAENIKKEAWDKAFEYDQKLFMLKTCLIEGTKGYSTYAHELAHALSLNHAFVENKKNHLDIPEKGSTLENFMDYFKSTVDTSNNKVVESDPPNTFIKLQWDWMREGCLERENSFSHYITYILGISDEDVERQQQLLTNFTQDVESLFNSL